MSLARAVEHRGRDTVAETLAWTFPTVRFDLAPEAEGPHRLAVRSGRIDDLALTEVVMAGEMQARYRSGSDAVILSIFETGARRRYSPGAETLDYAAGEMSIAPVCEGDTHDNSARFFRRSIVLPQARIAEAAARHFHVVVPDRVEFEPRLAADHESVGPFQALFAHAFATAGLFDEHHRAALERQQVDLMISSLLLGVPNTLSDVLDRTGGAIHPRRVRRAVEFMQENLDKPLMLDDIARHVGASPRTLQINFQHCFGLAPLAKLRAMRLEAAQAKLKEGRVDNIHHLAASIGFGHCGRFSAAFKAAYGIYPSEMLRG